MATNDFQPFAYGGAANVVSQSAYLALTTILQNGFSSGVAQSAQLNKVWRQSSIMAAVLAQFSSDYSGQNSTDDGTTATLETNLIAAIRGATKTGVLLTDTGSANAYTASNVPALTSGQLVNGLVQQVVIAHANTGASTYAPDGLTAYPIYGLGLQTLQGGELYAGGTAVLMRATIAGINSGNPIWLLMECAGGAQQVAPATQSQHAAQLQQVGHGQCRLSVTNTTTLTLFPYNGNNLIINGVPRQIPSAGVTISNAGLAASTLYYVYASWSGSAVALNLSTTGHGTATTGVETKSSDTTQTLVGMIYTSASSQFVVDSATTRQCLNWFYRRSLPMNIVGTVGNFTNTTAAEIDTSKRLFFLSWGDEATYVAVSGEASNSNTGFNVLAISAIDGAQVGPQSGGTISSGGYNTGFSSSATVSLTEGFHTAQVFGLVGGGTGSMAGCGNTAIVRG